MINFKRNDLINLTIETFKDTYNLLLDTGRTIPERELKFIRRNIHKAIKRSFKDIEKEDRYYQRTLRWQWWKLRRKVVKEDARRYLQSLIENYYVLDEITDETAETERNGGGNSTN